MRTLFAVACMVVLSVPNAAAQKPTPSKPPVSRPQTPKPQPFVELAEPPAMILLDPQSHRFVVGDKWIYEVFSPDTAFDGRTVVITLTSKDTAKAVFDVLLDGDVARTSEVAVKELTWFGPVENEPGKLGIMAVGDLFPKRAEKGASWSTSARNFQYDAAGNRTGETGYRVFGTPPLTCVARVGTYPCVSTMLFPFDEPFSYAVSFTQDVPAVLASQVKRAKDAGYVIFELVGFNAGGSDSLAATPRLPALQRNMAVNWLKSHTKFDSNAPLVTNFIFLLQEGARTWPGATLEFSVGSGLTKDGIGYVLQWRNGKFSSRPMTPAEEMASEPKQLKRQLIRPKV